MLCFLPPSLLLALAPSVARANVKEGALWRLNRYYYTSHSLWKIWLVESIQSIYNSLWTWHDNWISAADIAFIMSSSTSAWLLSPLECSPQKQNGWMLRFCFWRWTIPANPQSTKTWRQPQKCSKWEPFLALLTQTSVLIIHDIMFNLNQ